MTDLGLPHGGCWWEGCKICNTEHNPYPTSWKNGKDMHNDYTPLGYASLGETPSGSDPLTVKFTDEQLDALQSLLNLIHWDDLSVSYWIMLPEALRENLRMAW